MSLSRSPTSSSSSSSSSSSASRSTGSEVSDAIRDDDPAKTRRAAVESMVVHSDGDSMWTVYSGGKPNQYHVFAFDGLSRWKCECPDHIHRRCECKHIRRVQMVLGLRPIPDLSGSRMSDVEYMMEARARVAAERLARTDATTVDTSEAVSEVSA